MYPNFFLFFHFFLHFWAQAKKFSAIISTLNHFCSAPMAETLDIPLGQSTQMDSQPDPANDSVAEAAEDALRREAELAGSGFNCSLCGQRFAEEDVVAKCQATVNGAKKFRCKKCNAISTMLHRNMKWPPEEFSAMSAEDQTAFWQSCHESNDGGRFKYSAIRAKLVKQMVHRLTHESSAEEFTEAKPLSVWEKEGYPTKDIMDKGRKSVNPILGDVYEVPISRKSHKVLLQRIEQRLTEAEQSIKEKRGTAEATVLEQEEDAEEEAELPRKRSGKGKQPSEAASLKKQQAEDRKQNSKVTAAATKIHNYLDKTFQENKKTVELSKEHADSLPNALVMDLSADFEKVQKVLAESAAAIKQSATVATKGGRLNDLSHDFKEIVLLSNDFKNGARQAKVIMKALKLCK
jgi:hypothetical protein